MILLPRQETFYSHRILCTILGSEWSQLQAVANRAGAYYKTFDEQQGGKRRHFDAPRSPLKEIQKKVARFLRASVSFPKTMLGGLAGGSPRKNAEAHAGQPVICKLDIRNCFPSIGHERVFKVFRNQLNLSAELSNILTKLTTFQNRLPQGAPTSNIVANLALLPLHDEIQAICSPRGVICTFFVDDITLSGGEQAREILGSVIKLVQRHGFTIRSRKVKVLARHRDNQSVTGVTVNGGIISIGRERKNTIRSQIHKLSRLSAISSTARRSLFSTIANAKYISKIQGEKLEELARRTLPKTVMDAGSNPPKRIWHKCKSTHTHRPRRLN